MHALSSSFIILFLVIVSGFTSSKISKLSYLIFREKRRNFLHCPDRLVVQEFLFQFNMRCFFQFIEQSINAEKKGNLVKLRVYAIMLIENEDLVCQVSLAQFVLHCGKMPLSYYWLGLYFRWIPRIQRTLPVSKDSRDAIHASGNEVHIRNLIAYLVYWYYQ